MGITIDISENGAQALKDTSDKLINAVDQIDNALKRLSDTERTVGKDLGIYGDEIRRFIADQEEHIKKGRESIVCLTHRLDRLTAWILLKVSEYHKEESAAVIASANEALHMDGERVVYKDRAPAFSNLEFAEQENGSVFVKGNNYDKFIQEYYDSQNSLLEHTEGIVVETVSPLMIEGIHMTRADVDDPKAFWGDKKPFFIETASHIPEVRQALSQGRELSEVIEDPVIGECAALYFSPGNIPRVEKNDGYYSFNGDGRHRILAARELGFDIPVRVEGVRHYWTDTA